MSSKIDIRDVLTEHLDTLRDARTRRLSLWDLTVFFAVPLAIGALIFATDIKLTTTAIGILIGALSILAGLLINVLVLLYTVKEVGPTKSEKVDQRALINEVNANLMYAITVAVIDIVAICILPLLVGCVAAAWTAAVVALLANFILTLLMALKRLKVLLGLRFKVPPSEVSGES